MAISERIQERLRRLPESSQNEVMDFVEYLLTRSERDADRHDRRDWSHLSLSCAMRGMEGEAGPEYSVSDLKIVFS
jgi:hypothetical protein